jgi:superfamily II RNA helicase
MIINLLRVEDMGVEDMIRRSFSEFFAQRERPQQQLLIQSVERRIRLLFEAASECSHHDAAAMQAYYTMYKDYRTSLTAMMRTLFSPKYADATFKTGRVLLLSLPRFGLTSAPAVLLQAQAPLVVQGADRAGTCRRIFVVEVGTKCAHHAALHGVYICSVAGGNHKNYTVLVLCPARWTPPAVVVAKVYLPAVGAL